MGGGLGESLGVDEIDEYSVPVDPMDELQCESCQ